MKATAVSFASRTVADVVAENYARAMVFKHHGIDFCCGGGRSVEDACALAGVSFDTVAREIAGADDRSAAASHWDDPRSWPLDLVVDHVVKTHHRYVRRALPALVQFTAKVARVHGEAYPAVVDVSNLVDELARVMPVHLEEEETSLFPFITSGPEDDPSRLRDLVGQLEDDHDHAGGIMRRLREITAGYSPPPEACNTWRASWKLLAEFEEDLHRHVHLENNVLFPRALAAAGCSDSGAPTAGGAPP